MAVPARRHALVGGAVAATLVLACALSGCTATPSAPAAPGTAAPPTTTETVAPPAGDGVLHIATFVPSRGRGSAASTAVRAAADLAAHDAVAAGGVPDVELVVDHRDGTASATSFARWAVRHGVDAVIVAQGAADEVADRLAAGDSTAVLIVPDDAEASRALERRLRASDPWSGPSAGAASAYAAVTALAVSALLAGDAPEALAATLPALAAPGVPCASFDECRYELEHAPLDTDGLAVADLSEWSPASH